MMKRRKLDSGNDNEDDVATTANAGGAPGEICAAVKLSGNQKKLGVACYDSFSNTLSFTELYICEGGLAEELLSVQQHLQATTIVVSTDIDEDVIEIIKSNHKFLQGSDDVQALGEVDIIQQQAQSFNFKRVRLLTTYFLLCT